MNFAADEQYLIILRQAGDIYGSKSRGSDSAPPAAMMAAANDVVTRWEAKEGGDVTRGL